MKATPLKTLALTAFTVVVAPSFGFAESHPEHPAIAAPERPLLTSCYTIATNSLAAALVLEEIEGEAIDVFGYGDVTTAEGETWGFLIGFSGLLDQAFLSGTSSVTVEGALVETTIQWAFVKDGLVTEMGTFAVADCEGITEEYLDRVTN